MGVLAKEADAIVGHDLAFSREQHELRDAIHFKALREFRHECRAKAKGRPGHLRAVRVERALGLVERGQDDLEVAVHLLTNPSV